MGVIYTSCLQFDLLRSLKTGVGKQKPLLNNYRPPCAQLTREVKLHCC